MTFDVKFGTEPMALKAEIGTEPVTLPVAFQTETTFSVPFDRLPTMDDLLPEGFHEVEYLQSSGAQCIRTEYIPLSQDVISVRNVRALSPYLRWSTIFGTASADNAADAFCIRVLDSTQLCYDRGVYSNQKRNITPNHAELLTMTASTLTLDDVSYTVSSAGNTPVYPVYLFVRDLGGAPESGRFCTCRIGRFQVERDGARVVQLVPCIDAEGRPCYYDTLSRKTLYNTESGAEFSHGAVVEGGPL